MATLAGFSWLFVPPLKLKVRGVENPHIGLLLSIAIPIVLLAGLALIPIGIALARPEVASDLRAN